MNHDVMVEFIVIGAVVNLTVAIPITDRVVLLGDPTGQVFKNMTSFRRLHT